MATQACEYRRCSSRLAIVVLALFALPLPATAAPGVSQGVPLRNQSPFLQIFGLPPFQTARLAPEGSSEYNLSLDIVSHAESGIGRTEEISIDGESNFLMLSLRRGLSSGFELGFDLPLVSHGGGFLDSTIKGWHDLLGLSNSKRLGVNDQLGIRYSNNGQSSYELDSESFGIGDLQLTAALPLRKATEDSALSVSVRSSIKLPTGSADELSGSGAADLSLGLYASNSYSLWRREFDVSGFAGVLLLGDGDVLSPLQRGAVPYGGAAASWWLGERFAISTQLQLEGQYFDSELNELGGTSAQLAVGLDYRLRGGGTSLHFAITEDVAAGTTTTPDFGVHFSVRRFGVR